MIYTAPPRAPFARALTELGSAVLTVALVCASLWPSLMLIVDGHSWWAPAFSVASTTALACGLSRFLLNRSWPGLLVGLLITAGSALVLCVPSSERLGPIPTGKTWEALQRAADQLASSVVNDVAPVRPVPEVTTAVVVVAGLVAIAIEACLHAIVPAARRRVPALAVPVLMAAPLATSFFVERPLGAGVIVPVLLAILACLLVPTNLPAAQAAYRGQRRGRPRGPAGTRRRAWGNPLRFVSVTAASAAVLLCLALVTPTALVPDPQAGRFPVGSRWVSPGSSSGVDPFLDLSRDLRSPLSKNIITYATSDKDADPYLRTSVITNLFAKKWGPDTPEGGIYSSGDSLQADSGPAQHEMEGTGYSSRMAYTLMNTPNVEPSDVEVGLDAHDYASPWLVMPQGTFTTADPPSTYVSVEGASTLRQIRGRSIKGGQYRAQLAQEPEEKLLKASPSLQEVAKSPESYSDYMDPQPSPGDVRISDPETGEAIGAGADLTVDPDTGNIVGPDGESLNIQTFNGDDWVAYAGDRPQDGNEAETGDDSEDWEDEGWADDSEDDEGWANGNGFEDFAKRNQVDQDRIPAPIRKAASKAVKENGGGDSPYETAQALRSYLRGGDFVYSEEAPIRADGKTGGVDMVERFLKDKRGYCVHFASAFALMARAQGIPSRIAVGYTSGAVTRDGTVAGVKGTVREVNSQQAHAWTELYFVGVGWVPFDATPGFAGTTADDALAPDAQTSTPATNDPSARPTDQTQSQAPEASTSQASTSYSSSTASTGAGSAHGPRSGGHAAAWWWTAVAIVAALVVVALGAWRLLPGWLQSRRDARILRGGPETARRAWVEVARAAGVHGGAVWAQPAPESARAWFPEPRGEDEAGDTTDDGRSRASAAAARVAAAVDQERFSRPGSFEADPQALMDDVRVVRVASQAGRSASRRH